MHPATNDANAAPEVVGTSVTEATRAGAGGSGTAAAAAWFGWGEVWGGRRLEYSQCFGLDQHIGPRLHCDRCINHPTQ